MRLLFLTLANIEHSLYFFLVLFFLFQKGSYFLFNLFNFASEIVQAFFKGCNKNYPLIGKICKKNY